MNRNYCSFENIIPSSYSGSHETYKNGFLLVIIGILSIAFVSSVQAQPLDIGDRRQLFIDRMFIESSKNIELCIHEPRKTGDICIPSDPLWELGGYNSVLFHEGIYHMWYTASSSPPENAVIAYARSNDGIYWERPFLNLTEDNTLPRPNNVVIGRGAGGTKYGTHGLMVFLDPNAPGDQRFKLVANPKEFGRFLQIFSSPDGIHWKHTHRDVVTYDTTAKPHHLDTQNVIFWDSRIKEYVTYIRKNSMQPGSVQGRSVGRGESPTLSSFGKVADMPFVMSAGGKEDIYTNGVILYPWADNVYFSFPTFYYHYGKWQNEFITETPTNAGVTDARFAVSRDGIKWDNFNWHTFVPRGMDGEFDSKRIYMVYGIVPSLNGREMYMYYWGTNETHGWNRDDRNNRILTAAGVAPRPMQRAISRVVLRRDGFVSLHAPYEGGEFTTPPLRFHGNQLLLNVETASTGEVLVEIQNEKGKALKGLTLEDCDLIHTANEINRQVKWNGSSMIGKLTGKTIRLHFVLRDADLYAFQFCESPADK